MSLLRARISMLMYSVVARCPDWSHTSHTARVLMLPFWIGRLAVGQTHLIGCQAKRTLCQEPRAEGFHHRLAEFSVGETEQARVDSRAEVLQRESDGVHFQGNVAGTYHQTKDQYSHVREPAHEVNPDDQGNPLRCSVISALRGHARLALRAGGVIA